MTNTRTGILRPGDRIVFLGDSITEQQLYSNYVESYLASRYPDLGLTFFNAGWGGDTAPGGVERLERDVLSLKPTLVTISYGMNDGRYTEPTDEIRATFRTGLRALVERLLDAGIRVVLLTPGMADAQAALFLAACDYNARGLRVMADEVLALAAEKGVPVADLHALMTDVTCRARVTEPAFCMVPDGVHPDPAGHLVMAYGLLQALGVPPRRQEIVVDLALRRVEAAGGVRAGRLTVTRYGFTLGLQLDTLPFFVELAARKVLPFLPFQETYNDLRLRVDGLPAERAFFRSAVSRGVSLPREAWAIGINVFDQWAVDILQRAERVHRFTIEKNQAYYRLWRVLGLDGVKNAARAGRAFDIARRLSPALDRARDALLKGRAALTARLNVVATDLPGEPLLDGDFIGQWWLRGPFPKPYATDALGGEAAFSAAAGRLDSAWQLQAMNLVAPGDNLTPVFGAKTDCFAYALVQLESPAEQEAVLCLGSDDGVAAWLNGASVHSHLEVARGLAPDQDRVPVRLRRGTNRLLLKISQGMGGWGFCARFQALRRPIASVPPG